MSDLTRLTVNLTRRSVAALESASNRTGDGKTGTLNRALVAYEVLLRLIEQGEGQIRVTHADGTREVVTIL